MHRALAVIAAIGIVSSFGCTANKEEGAAPTSSEAPKPPPTPDLENLPLGLDEGSVNIPADNPLTAEKIDLGWHLYYDKRLSKDGTIACVTCHTPEHGWSDGKPLMVGIGNQVGGRNSPTILNRLFSDLQFWDGRAASLEEQALGPIQAGKEMGNTLENMVATLSAIEGYKPKFTAAFGDDKVTADRVAKAIASFERTVLSGNSPYDRYLAGDKAAMNESAVRGMAVFLDNNKGRCSICHAGSNFTDEAYHNIGVGMDDPDWETSHIGRFAVTKKEEDKGSYKTPTLRNVADSGPYMHDGSDATLEATVDFYVKGGHPSPYLDKEMKPLTLTDQEKKDLVEFMQALSGEVTPVSAPPQL